MKITTSVTIPDYVYLFYEKAAKELQLRKTEDLMSDTLIRYAASISKEILNNHKTE